jgi:hypothetical protein
MTTRTLLSLALVLPLTGCVVPKIVGDNPELDTGKEEDDVGDTAEEETLGATSQPDATSDIGTSTGDVSTTDPTAETGPKFDMMPPDPGDCAAATLEACEANPDCMPVLGQSELSDTCKPDPQFLGCLPQQPCDAVLLTVCDEETDESFRLSSGCIPEGFAVCEGNGLPCGGGMQCEGLGQADCATFGCTEVLGAPHVTVNDEVCADYEALEFLACLPPETSCPPVIQILCPTGQDAPTWDVPSGCKPAGFEDCGGVVPACE